MNRSLSALVLGLLFACAPAEHYGMRYPPELRGGLAAMDAGVDCLVARIEELGLLTPGAAARMLRAANLEVRTYAEPIETGRAGVQLSGMHSPDGIVWFLWAPGAPLPDTSFQHELVHALLCRAQPIGPACWGDTGHDARAWWLPVLEPARKCWRDALETSAR